MCSPPMEELGILFLYYILCDPTPHSITIFHTMALNNFTMLIFCFIFVALSRGCEGRALRGLSETMDDDFHGSTGYETDDTIDIYYGIHGGYDGSDVYFGDSDGPDDSPLDEDSPESHDLTEPLTFAELQEIENNKRKQEESERQTYGLIAGASFIVLVIGGLYKKCKNKC